MSEKTLRACLYFLGAVTVLYFVITLAGGGSGGASAGGSGLAAAFEGIDGETLTGVDLIGPRETIRLERAGDDWTVNGFEADSGAVARFLRALDEVEVGPVAAANPANHERLGVSTDSAWTLTTDGGTTVLLGKTGNRFRTAYARLPDADQVSLIEGDLRAAAARPLFDWRDKVILSADTAAIASIHVARDGETVIYERGDSSWTVGGDGVEADDAEAGSDGAEADATTVRNMLQEIAGLRASGFAPQDAEMPEEPDRTVLALDADGNEVASLSLAEQEGNFRVSASASPYIFEVPTFRADRVAPAPPDDS